MTTVELARLVSEMRRAQREYFRTRSSAALDESKALERRVDQAVAECLDGQARLRWDDGTPADEGVTR